MDRPGESRIDDAFLNGGQENYQQSRSVIKSSMNNHNDFSEAYLKINEVVNDPRYENHMRPKSPQIHQWNRSVQMQADQNRRDLSSKLSGIRQIIGGDPALQPVTSQVNNILNDFDRNPNRDLSNQLYVDHNKKRNRQVIMVVDDEYSKTNRHPRFSAAPEVSRTSTVRIYQNNENVLTKYEVDKEYQGDNVNIIQVKQATQPGDRFISSSKKKPRPVRTPVKLAVDVNSGKIHSNPNYEPHNMVKSYIHHDEAKKKFEPIDQKIIYANDTDPRSSSKKKPRTFERLIVATNVESNPPSPDQKKEPEFERIIFQTNDYRPESQKKEPEVERVIIHPNDYKPAQNPKPQPFQQYPVYEKKHIEPVHSAKYVEHSRYVKPKPIEVYSPTFDKITQQPHYIQKYEERTYIHNQRRLPIHPQPPIHAQPAYQVIQERRVQEPYFEEKVHAHVRAVPKKVARSIKLNESREVGIINSAEYFGKQPQFSRIDIENCKII